MPTKINKAGNQQSYVPAGNGDASGEYGDNATGSNKHFTSFETPKKQKNFIKQPKFVIGDYQKEKQIMELTGVDWNKAKEFREAIKWYTDGGDKDIRSGRNEITSNVIEEYINKSPKFDGEIYRGLSFEEDEGFKYLKILEYAKDNNCLIDMKGISSWSSAKPIAEDFANQKKGTGAVGFIIKLENKTGVPIAYLSSWEGEYEVLQSKKTKYKVKNIQKEEYNPYSAGFIYNIEMEEI